MKKQQIISITITALFIVATIALEAQPGSGGGQGGPPPPGSGSVPIDGGAILLAVGAAIYGRKKLMENKEN